MPSDHTDLPVACQCLHLQPKYYLQKIIHFARGGGGFDLLPLFEKYDIDMMQAGYGVFASNLSPQNATGIASPRLPRD